MFNCEICEYETHLKYNYDRHLTSKKHLKKLNPDPEPEKVFKCEECEKSFKSASSYSRHKKTHNDDRSMTLLYHCKKCVKSFRDKYNLMSHCKTSAHLKKCDIDVKDELQALRSSESIQKGVKYTTAERKRLQKLARSGVATKKKVVRGLKKSKSALVVEEEDNNEVPTTHKPKVFDVNKYIEYFNLSVDEMLILTMEFKDYVESNNKDIENYFDFKDYLTNEPIEELYIQVYDTVHDPEMIKEIEEDYD